MNDRLEKSPRIEVVDALRGFAVMAILLVHSLEHFIFPVYPLEPAAWLATLDKIVFDTTFFLFAGNKLAHSRLVPASSPFNLVISYTLRLVFPH